MKKKKFNTAKKRAPAGKGKPRMAGALAKIANVIASPVITVNGIMQWLNSQFGLHLPVLPLKGWPPVLQSLWEMFIAGGIPSGPPPWNIHIEGNWPAIFPQVGSPPVMLANLVIHVEEKVSSPTS